MIFVLGSKRWTKIHRVCTARGSYRATRPSSPQGQKRAVLPRLGPVPAGLLPLRPYRYPRGCPGPSRSRCINWAIWGRARPTSSNSSPLLKTSAGVPWAMSRPSCITARRLTSRATSSMLWDTNTTVTPCCCRALISPRISCRPMGSRPAVGSSRIRYLGRMASTPAMATCLFWPPPQFEGRPVGYLPSNPTIAKASSTRSFTSSSGRPMFRGPKATSAKTVSSKS